MEPDSKVYISKHIKTRTAGDGMESEIDKNENKPNICNTPSDNITSPNRKLILPQKKLIQVYPKEIIKHDKRKHVYPKNPKFVPYEPYPGAVKPIVPQVTTIIPKKFSKNNMDINTLIQQMSQMNTNISEYKPRTRLLSLDEKCNEGHSATEAELQKKITVLTTENETLKDQLQQQAQVNKELKTMLVASMGEDLETQVQTLNDDKKHLSTALLNSAKHLSTHQEQTEWLAGQCEVWRSKFLASSLMVEELANWKKVLNQRTDDLQQTITQMLDERCRVRDMMLCTYKNLYSLHENWLQNVALAEHVGNKSIFNTPIGNMNLTVPTPQSSNILDLSSVNMKLSENFSCNIDKKDVSHVHSLPFATEGEINAEYALGRPIEVTKANEEPVKALVNHAYSSSGATVRPIAACMHCNGNVQLL